MGRQLERNDFAGNTGEIGVDFPAFRVTDPAKNDMIQRMHGALPRRHTVRGRVGYHIGPDRKIQLPTGKDLTQANQILRRGKIHGDIMGEEIHVELVRHRHTDNLTADQRGLGFLGPGEFVDCQIDFHAQIPDCRDDALMRQREGVEGAWEECRLAPFLEDKGTAFDTMPDSEAVDMGQRGGGIEEGQFLFRLFVNQEKNLFGHQREEAGLVLVAQNLRGKQFLAQNLQSLLPHRFQTGRQALQQQSGHTFLTCLPRKLRLLEAPGVNGIVLQRRPDCRQRRRRNAGTGGGEEQMQLIQHFVQLPGRKPEDKLTQIQGDIL